MIYLYLYLNLRLSQDILQLADVPADLRPGQACRRPRHPEGDYGKSSWLNAAAWDYARAWIWAKTSVHVIG